jgi:hypothetical protein
MKFSLLASIAIAIAATVFTVSDGHAGSIQPGWTCSGNCGTDGADGVVSLAPLGGSQYDWVSTNGGLAGAGEIPSVGGTNGSAIKTSDFSANAGDSLNFDFNYVTSDGAGYSDYGWAALYTSSGNLVAYLFTARTEPSGTISPGVGLPADAATLTPTTSGIIGGAPNWSPLGSSSGTCWSAGCGYTGWIQSNYTITSAGSFFIEAGVTNMVDTLYQTGMALAGVTVAGKAIDTPEPASITLFGAGLVSVGWLRRRRRA